jgi:hypothetical protein
MKGFFGEKDLRMQADFEENKPICYSVQLGFLTGARGLKYFF